MKTAKEVLIETSVRFLLNKGEDKATLLRLFPECSHLILEYGQSDNPNENSDSELEQVEKDSTMPLPIKNEINLVFSSLPDLISDWNAAMQKAFAEESEDNKIEVLEAILKVLPEMQEKFDSEIGKLSKKIEKEIAKEKKQIT